LREWGSNTALIPAYVIRLSRSVPLVVIAVLLGALVFSIGLVLAVVTWVAAICGVAVSATSHLALGRPFLIEAQSSHGAWVAWWVTGWRSARRARHEIRRSLDSGGDIHRLTIDGATRFERAESANPDDR
jgi:hypothetical protein